MKRKKLLVCVLNFIAFGSIFRTIYSEMGPRVFWELLAPCAIIFGTNIAAILLQICKTGDVAGDSKAVDEDVRQRTELCPENPPSDEP